MKLRHIINSLLIFISRLSLSLIVLSLHLILTSLSFVSGLNTVLVILGCPPATYVRSISSISALGILNFLITSCRFFVYIILKSDTSLPKLSRDCGTAGGELSCELDRGRYPANNSAANSFTIMLI